MWSGGKSLIHGTIHHNDNQLQSLELSPAKYPNWEYKFDIK